MRLLAGHYLYFVVNPNSVFQFFSFPDPAPNTGITMTENQINQRANKLAAKLIESNRDNFDIGLALSLHELIEQIKKKRGIGVRLARKTAINLLCLD